VSAAGLDHFEGESLAVDHPLTGFDSVVLAPHIGGATYDTESNHTAIIAEDLCRLLAGARPLHIVNPRCWTADETGPSTLLPAPPPGTLGPWVGIRQWGNAEPCCGIASVERVER